MDSEPVIAVTRYSKDGRKAWAQYASPKGKRWQWVDINRIPESMRKDKPVPPSPTIDREAFLRPEPRGSVVDSYPPEEKKEPPRVTKRTSYNQLVRMFKVSTGVMSEKEAESIQDEFEKASIELFELADKIHSASLRGHPMVVVWSDIDDADNAKLCSAVLALATRHSGAATFVRVSVNVYHHIQVLQIVGPRMVKMYMNYVFYGFEMPGNRAWRQRMMKGRQV